MLWSIQRKLLFYHDIRCHLDHHLHL
jgi:hypothetical protein